MRGVDRGERAAIADEKLAPRRPRGVRRRARSTSSRAACSSASASPARWPTIRAVLLMDEPMGALDAFTREQVQDVLLRVWAATAQDGLLHHPRVEEALFLATRLIVMTPSPGRISHAYDDMPFSRQFLGHGDARKVKSEPRVHPPARRGARRSSTTATRRRRAWRAESSACLTSTPRAAAVVPIASPLAVPPATTRARAEDERASRCRAKARA